MTHDACPTVVVHSIKMEGTSDFKSGSHAMRPLRDSVRRPSHIAHGSFCFVQRSILLRPSAHFVRVIVNISIYLREKDECEKDVFVCARRERTPLIFIPRQQNDSVKVKCLHTELVQSHDAFS